VCACSLFFLLCAGACSGESSARRAVTGVDRLKKTDFTPKELLRRFCMIDSTYWLSIAGFNALSIAYVRTLGVTVLQVSIMTAVFRVAAILGQFFWSALCDRRQKNREYALIMLTLLVGADLFLYYSQVWPAIIVSYTLVGFIQLPLNTNMDTWIIRSFNGDGTAMPRVRSVGSLFYTVAIIGIALVIDETGYIILPIMLLTFYVVLGFLILNTVPPKQQLEPMRRGISMKNVSTLMKIPGYGLCMAIMFVFCFGFMTLWNMITLVFESVNGTAADLSYYSGIMTLAEAPAMYLVAALSFKIRQEKQLFLGVILAMVQTVMLFVAESPLLMILSGIASGVSYAFFYAPIRGLVQRMVPQSLATTAHGLMDAACFSAAGCLGSLCAGGAIEAWGVRAFTLGCLVIEGVSFVLLIIYTATEPKRAQRRAAALAACASEQTAQPV
jgi:predicted MFS family arabinose efflux permease